MTTGCRTQATGDGPGAGHVDLYDRVDLIPFDTLATFFQNSSNITLLSWAVPWQLSVPSATMRRFIGEQFPQGKYLPVRPAFMITAPPERAPLGNQVS